MEAVNVLNPEASERPGLSMHQYLYLKYILPFIANYVKIDTI